MTKIYLFQIEEELGEEFQVRVTTHEPKDIEWEEVVEERTVTRKKKPKTVPLQEDETPEDFTFKLGEPETVEEEIKLPVKEQKPIEEADAEIEIKLEEPVEEVKVIEVVDEEVKKKKKPKKKEEAPKPEKVEVVDEEPTPVEALKIEEVTDDVQETFDDYEVGIIDVETIDDVIEDVPEEMPISQPEIIEEEEDLPIQQFEVGVKEEKIVEVDDVIEEKTVTRKKKPKPQPEQPEEEFTVKFREPDVVIPVEETPEAEIVLKKEVPKPQEEEEAQLEIQVKEIVQPEEVPEEQVTLKKKKPKSKPKVVEEVPEEFTIKEKKPESKQPEEVEAEISIPKQKPVIQEEAADELSIKVVDEIPEEKEIVIEEEEEEPSEFIVKKKKPVQPAEEYEVEVKLPAEKKTEELPAENVTIKKKKTKKAPEEEEAQLLEVQIKLGKEKPVEQPEEQLTLKKKKPKKAQKDEEASLELQQEVVEERPVEVLEEEIIDEAIIKRPRPKPKPIQPTYEDLPEEEFSFSVSRPKVHKITQGVEGEGSITKKRPIKLTTDEASAELSIKKLEDYEETSDVEEFVIQQKPKRRPSQYIEEEEQKYTVKKLRRPKKGRTDIPEYTDVENVTFRAKSTKNVEDVDQEFSIALDSYAEEEISMSSKVRLKKERAKTYNEETGEAHIKIVQEYDDDGVPIIEEIYDSEPENTMDDIDEPEEFDEAEELPHDEVQFKLKPKKPKKAYTVHDEDEEEFRIGVARKREDSVTYDEESHTIRKKKRKPKKTYDEGKHLLFFEKLYNSKSKFRFKLMKLIQII